ncbi:hypothetical protein ACPCBX_01585 [Streptomyces tuirus]|uniref:hypothetical protein n=1 Tax=Streptomyces tuirus TaxID=68278 RepID=UPI00168223AE|nr:hypothetical protein [Streptomyces tuirus]
MAERNHYPTRRCRSPPPRADLGTPKLPPEAFFQRDGLRLPEQGRHQLDLRHPAARAHLDKTGDRIAGDRGVGHLKLDYNIVVDRELRLGRHAQDAVDVSRSTHADRHDSASRSGKGRQGRPDGRPAPVVGGRRRGPSGTRRD